jgi:hypothetical protein
MATRGPGSQPRRCPKVREDHLAAPCAKASSENSQHHSAAAETARLHGPPWAVRKHKPCNDPLRALTAPRPQENNADEFQNHDAGRPDQGERAVRQALRDLDGAVKTRERLFSELKAELELHTSLEEQHLFPILRRNPETKGLVADASRTTRSCAPSSPSSTPCPRTTRPSRSGSRSCRRRSGSTRATRRRNSCRRCSGR